MTIFAIIANSNPQIMQSAITAQYGANHYKFAENVWFVADSGNTKSVADKLKITDGQSGAWGVVIELAAYSGYASSAAWQWLQAYPEARSNG